MVVSVKVTESSDMPVHEELVSLKALVTRREEFHACIITKKQAHHTACEGGVRLNSQHTLLLE
jgi:hypothetical protein